MHPFVKKRLTFFFLICAISLYAKGQDKSYSKRGKQNYQEMSNPVGTDVAAWNKLGKAVQVSFAGDERRYAKEQVPELLQQDEWHADAWRAETVHTQVLVWSNTGISNLHFSIGALRSASGATISRKSIQGAFLRYVLSDTFEDGCAHEAPNRYDSTLVADPIDRINRMDVPANSVRPIWLSIAVPAGTAPGTYTGKMTVFANGRHELRISLKVNPHLLPKPKKWAFQLDLWQYPMAIARIHQVVPWSKMHFKLMRPYFEALANAGQKVITANIIPHPWGPDHSNFEDLSLIRWVRKKDGTWFYDFSLFDRYIEFVQSCGITNRINCYSMISWDLSYRYFDEATGADVVRKFQPDTKAFSDFWTPMLQAFTSHLKTRNWFSKTAIAMDERPLENMQAAIAVLKAVDPAWRISLAGDVFHPEIAASIDDYALASYIQVPDSLIRVRNLQGKSTSFYTACVEEYPNAYTFSSPAESTFFGWYAAAKGYSGYLFWAFNSWVNDPLRDARWKRYPSGTLFQFYPGPRSSVRFEKLREGIQDFEKVRLLREEFIREHQEEKLRELNQILSAIDLHNLERASAAILISSAKAALNAL